MKSLFAGPTPSPQPSPFTGEGAKRAKGADPVQIWTISQLNQAARDLLEESLPALWVEGEISNFKYHANGHMYFTLKDEKAQIDAVIFAEQNALLEFEPAAGQKVIALGQITLYEKRGRYQINIYEMRPAGIGKLQLEFERLKARLAAEGLFDQRFKQPIPQYPERIGIVTAPGGAALQDMLKILRERYPIVEVLLFTVRVQGDGAAQEIAEAVRMANRYHQYEEAIDVLIVGRGGGALEDLWAFNEEPVARALFESAIPIVTGIGHEIDFTIADFVADQRAPTPTAAAQMVVPERALLLNFTAGATERLKSLMDYRLDDQKSRLQMLRSRRGLHRPLQLLREHRQTRDHAQELLVRTLRERSCKLQERGRGLLGRLESLNPASVLRRGFSIVETPDGRIVHSVEQATVGQQLRVRLHRGRLLTRVEAKEAADGEKDS